MNETTTVLRGGGACLVLVQDGESLPAVLHWGADLSDDALPDLLLVRDGPAAHNALDDPWDLTVLPTSGDGWLGTPGFVAHRAGGSTAPRWTATVGVDGPPCGRPRRVHGGPGGRRAGLHPRRPRRPHRLGRGDLDGRPGPASAGARRAAHAPAAADEGRRGARPHRALDARTRPAAAPGHRRVVRADRSPGPDRSGRHAPPHGGRGRVRLPPRRGVVRPRRLERQPRAPRRAPSRAGRGAHRGRRWG